MENIYKIKIRSNPDPRGLYPSERRYSSSIVLGFSVTFLALSLTSTLMGTLVVRKLTTNVTNTTNERLWLKIERDLEEPSYSINFPAIVSVGSFIMSLGCLLCFITGMIAWKHWYIDNNIIWFFLATCFSSITSSISLLLISLTLMEANETEIPISLALMANIFITSLLGVIWSMLASKISFKGMTNSYPEDMVISKTGRVEVNTVRKGNKMGKVVPPDILNHFPKTGKLAKYFPKKENNYLPKAESNKEYEERVEKFLAGQPENDGKN